ncbi:MAG: hypothetical protein GYA62_05195 [Bacteroidales bacterium]|nr:hypothetical protein [Bacteroidales bacterium]
MINKIALELCAVLNINNDFNTVHRYIGMAVVGSADHFKNCTGDVYQYNRNYKKVAEYRNIYEAAKKTGINRQHINAVVIGKRRTAGGFIFIRKTK